MSSMLIEDICFDCNMNNGINSGMNCKYCSKLLCKNFWELELSSMSSFIISTTTPISHFSKFLLNQQFNVGGKKGYIYSFPYDKINLDFNKEVITLKISGLKKPLIIKFESIMKYDLEKHENNKYHSLTIYLKNMLVLSLGYNEYNLILYKIFNKWLDCFNI